MTDPNRHPDGGPLAVQMDTVYWWPDLLSGHPVAVTAACRYRGQLYGLTMACRPQPSLGKLDALNCINRTIDTLDALVHHGQKVLDADGNLNPRKLQDAEAERFWLDRAWRKAVRRFRQGVRVEQLTLAQARRLGLL